MSDISRENLSAFFRKQHGLLIGFTFCFFFTIFIQLTGQGLLIVIAGILTGFLMKNTFRAIVVAFIAGFLAWLALFGLLAFYYTDAFINAWNEFLAALIIMSQEKNFTLPILLTSVRSGLYGSVDWGALQAGVTVAIVPCVVLFLLLQRYYMRGLMGSAVKG